MKVAIITMQFPNPREAFASAEVNCLKEKVNEVTVHSMRFKHRANANLIMDRGLVDLEMSWFTIWTLFRFPVLFIKNLRFSVYGLGLILKNLPQEKKQGFKTLMLFPRALEIFEEIKSTKPDVVHSFWSHFPALVGLMVKQFGGIKVSMSLAAYDLTSYHWATRILLHKADRVTTIAERNVELIRAFENPKRNINVIHRGTDPKNFCFTYPQKIPYTIVTAGALIKGKRVDECIAVFEKVKRKYPQAILTILGDGPEMKTLQALANNNKDIIFKGHCSHQDVFEHIEKAQVFLLMSETEHIPNVVKEAMATRAYCISTNTTGINELLKPEFGSIIEIGDVAHATQEVDRAFSKPNDLKEQTALALKHLDRYFNYNNNLDKLISLWQHE